MVVRTGLDRKVSTLIAGQRIDGFYMVRRSELRPRREGSEPYLYMILGDRTGDIEAIAWEHAEALYGNANMGEVVKVRATVRTFNNELQLTIERMRPAEEQEYKIDDFLPSTDKDIDEMLDRLDHVIKSITEPQLRALLESVFKPDMRQQFAKAPAARMMHHAFLGGLLEHTLEVVRICELAAEMYPDVINRDLLIAGALLHDIGKLEEYTYDRTFAFTDKGTLIGHIVIGAELVSWAIKGIKGFPEDLEMKLKHLILSHHGTHEYQSPKEPQMMEAEVLFLADYFSGEANKFATAIGAKLDPKATWTPFDKRLRRRVYAPKK